MKTKITFLLLMIVSVTLYSFKQQTSPVLTLTNIKTNKSIKVCEKYNPDKIEALLGKAITLDKEILEKGEAPVFTFNYDGLVMEMQNDQMKLLTITNKKWKLNKFTIGVNVEDIAAVHEKHDAKFVRDRRFKVKNSKAVIFAQTDSEQKVTKLGVVF
ncbi:hypothetical protein [Flavobacterium terrae]|uniref:Intein N-terminal splicing region n=1 Tax=Flavobacterium terrae TaxID=415425 RepID=A0A1M6AIG1_9FLAO|nr:hypothetical protein [Flavobacterium terrae]SHI36181.1 hypothetical protein SAMN05444363_0229 [Flavobacterium terrae]